MGRGERKKKTYTSQPNKLSNLAPLLLNCQPLRPRNRTRIVSCPLARRPLVIELRKLLKLVVCEQPEIQKRRGKRRMYVARGQLDEWRQGEGHLLDLLVKLLVAVCSFCAEACCGGSIVVALVVIIVAGTVPWHVRGWWRVVMAALVHAEIVHLAADVGIGLDLPEFLLFLLSVDRLVIFCRGLSSGVCYAQSQMWRLYLSKQSEVGGDVCTERQV